MMTTMTTTVIITVDWSKKIRKVGFGLFEWRLRRKRRKREQKKIYRIEEKEKKNTFPPPSLVVHTEFLWEKKKKKPLFKTRDAEKKSGSKKGYHRRCRARYH